MPKNFSINAQTIPQLPDPCNCVQGENCGCDGNPPHLPPFSISDCGVPPAGYQFVEIDGRCALSPLYENNIIYNMQIPPVRPLSFDNVLHGNGNGVTLADQAQSFFAQNKGLVLVAVAAALYFATKK